MRLTAPLRRFNRRQSRMIDVTMEVLSAVSFLASLTCLVCFIIYVGYDHTTSDYVTLKRVLRAVRWVFFVNVVANLVFRDHSSSWGKSVLTLAVELSVLVVSISLLYPRPDHPWFPALARIIYNNHLIYPVLTAYAIVDMSKTIVRMGGRRVNPSLMLSASFVVFILIGSFLLMLPKCTYGDGLSYIQSLFISTSAVCITGLTPVDVSVHFTPLGLLVLACLIQIGGLGVLTFTSFFALFFAGNSSIYSQLMVRDIIYSKTMSSLLPTLLYIFVFTVMIEAAGAVMIFWCIHGQLGMDFQTEVYTAMFNSLSAFCNAGFSNISGGMGNVTLMHGNQAIYWVMSGLVVAGAIGFPILVNYKDLAVTRIKTWVRRLKGDRSAVAPAHLCDMNTKVVITTFTILFAGGAILFGLMESGNTLAGMSDWEKVSQSVFNSVTPRSAGFSSVPPGNFLNVTVVMVLFLMWVGGGAQSTAGGVKVNTLAAACINLSSVLRGSSSVHAFGRRISLTSLRRAHGVIVVSVFSYLLLSLALLWLEPGLPARDLLFESASALFTVGSSLGATPRLGDVSLVVLSVAMFLGRIGILSILAGFVSHSPADDVRYPTGNIIIN